MLFGEGTLRWARRWSGTVETGSFFAKLFPGSFDKAALAQGHDQLLEVRQRQSLDAGDLSQRQRSPAVGPGQLCHQTEAIVPPRTHLQHAATTKIRLI